MSYHPIFGIIFFVICLFIAFIFGKKSLLKKSNNTYFKKNNYQKNKDFISPDASWLDKNEKN